MNPSFLIGAALENRGKQWKYICIIFSCYTYEIFAS